MAVFEVEVERQSTIRVDVPITALTPEDAQAQIIEDLVIWELENGIPNGELEYVTDDISVLKVTEVD